MKTLKMTPNFLPLEKVEFTEEQLVEMYNLVFKSPKSNGFMKAEMKDLLFDKDYWFMDFRQDNWEENLKNKLIEFGVEF
jgi:hypothetical protein